MRSYFLLFCSAAVLLGQPSPGDVFREYRYTSDMIVELDPGSKREDPRLLMRRSISHRERSLDVYDLEDAVRAEVSLEFWGGHLGTSDQKFKVNGANWIQIPQIAGTPGDPRCFHRMLPGTVHAAIPLEALKQGRNSFEFRAGPQTCHGFDWGIYKVYSFIVRVYYNASKPHPTGRISSQAANGVIGDMPVIEAVTEGSNGDTTKTEFTPGAVNRVEFVGLYDDFNWEGDGQSRQWHYQTEQGVMKRHIGTVTEAPFRVTWDNRWIPDQDSPLQLAARVTNVHGVTYMTQPVPVRLVRGGRSVKMFKAVEIPEAFGVRAGKRMTCNIPVTANPLAASAARLAVSTWAGNHADAIGLNDHKIINRIGKEDYYSYDLVPFDPKILQKGANAFYIFSNTVQHAAEINWPGPAVLLEFKTKP